MLRLLERGISEAKLFPATAVGGITAATAPDFLALPNVGCVGGTWLTPPNAVAAKDWVHVRTLAQQVRRLSSR